MHHYVIVDYKEVKDTGRRKCIFMEKILVIDVKVGLNTTTPALQNTDR